MIDRILHRIGLSERPPADLSGLRTVHRAYVAAVPFEALAVQLGESGPLDPAALVERVLRGGRGGYCFEVNTVLQVLLEGLGFTVERRPGIVGPRGSGGPVNHLTLVVSLPEGAFVADAGLGEGPVEPLPLVDGTHAIGPLAFGVAREQDGWYVTFPEHTSTEGYWFADAPAALADFAPHHARLSRDPESGFVRTLVVERPGEDRVTTLRARTLIVVAPGGREERVVADAGEFAATLRDVFGIDPAELGPERLSRLWSAAVEQHARHVA